MEEAIGCVPKYMNQTWEQLFLNNIFYHIKADDWSKPAHSLIMLSLRSGLFSRVTDHGLK